MYAKYLAVNLVWTLLLEVLGHHFTVGVQVAFRLSFGTLNFEEILHRTAFKRAETTGKGSFATSARGVWYTQ